MGQHGAEVKPLGHLAQITIYMFLMLERELFYWSLDVLDSMIRPEIHFCFLNDANDLSFIVKQLNSPQLYHLL